MPNYLRNFVPGGTANYYQDWAKVISSMVTGNALASLFKRLWTSLRKVFVPSGGWRKLRSGKAKLPTLFIIYWALCVNKTSLRWFSSIIWCIYPIAYLCYSLMRGKITGSYPYPFIDVSTIGYQQALINSASLLVCFLVLGLVFVAAGKFIHK